ncbi:hypothetical protein PFISCL1PPCAC_12570, partial [Pristionchus fissidentatus]
LHSAQQALCSRIPASDHRTYISFDILAVPCAHSMHLSRYTDEVNMEFLGCSFLFHLIFHIFDDVERFLDDFCRVLHAFFELRAVHTVR